MVSYWVKAKLTPKSWTRGDNLTPTDKLGAFVTVDHSNASDGESKPRDGEGHGLLRVDKFSSYMYRFPSHEKCSHEVQYILRESEATKDHSDLAYSDNAPEFVRDVKRLGRLHETSAPYKSGTHGKIERRH